MNQKTSLTLYITADELTGFCEKLIKRSRDISKTHDALSTLEAFVTNFSRTSNQADAYQSIESILKSYTEKTRKHLLDEKTGALVHALIALDRHAITDVHHLLSRNGFYQILESAARQLSDSQLMSVTNWCTQWVNNAQQTAEQASGYPDAYDFKAADIDINEYQAMKDTSHFLSSLN